MSRSASRLSILVEILNTRDKLLVQGLHSAYVEPLRSIMLDTLTIQVEENSSYQLSFTAYDDGSISFKLLSVEASIYWGNDEYIVKQFQADHTNGFTTYQVTAVQACYDISRIRQRKTKTGTLTYSVNDVLSFYLQGNPFGYTWRVIGEFEKRQITDLGNGSGKDMLDQIVSTWPEAVFYPEKRIVRIYEHDSFVRNIGNRIDYIRDTPEIKMNYDSTALSNQVLASGKQKENTKDDKVEYYFDPFIVENKESIQKWGLHQGEDVPDERFTDKESMQKYALTKLSPEPALSIEVTQHLDERPRLGEIRRLEDRKDSFMTEVEIVGFTHYPANRRASTITLNNRAKNILDYQRSIKAGQQNAIKNQTKKINSLIKSVGAYEKRYQELKDDNSATQTTINNLQETIKNLQDKINNGNSGEDGGSGNDGGNDGNNPTNPPSDWKPGTMFMDISDYQSGFTQATYDKLFSQDIKGVIVKLTQGSENGTAYINSYFKQQKERAEKSGMKFIGTYHYLVSTSVADAQNEGKWYLKQLRAHNVPKDTIVACDLEDGVLSKNKSTLTAELKAFHKVLSDAGYTNTTDYSTSSWMNTRFTSQGKYKWIASWGIASKPAGADAWQFNSTFNGMSLDVDKSYNKAFI